MSKELPSKQKRVLVDLTTDKERYLVGWPGYRNVNGRSGLGYVETQVEWAHMRGRLFQQMYVGKIITRNPIFLLGMSIVGVIYSLPLILGLPDILSGSDMGAYVLFIMSPSWFFGLLILRNVLIALTTSEEEEGKSNENMLDDGNSSAYNPSHPGVVSELGPDREGDAR